MKTELKINNEWIKKETEKAIFVKIGLSGFFAWMPKSLVVTKEKQFTNLSIENWKKFSCKSFKEGKVKNEKELCVLGIQSEFQNLNLLTEKNSKGDLK